MEADAPPGTAGKPEPEETELGRLRQALKDIEDRRENLPQRTVDILSALARDRIGELEGPVSKQQRKYVTVLFADVTDFTSICEQHDAEYVTGLINTLWNALDSVVIDHGGIVDKHIGDAVMAVWGSEGVREDDTLRAIRAALQMQETAGRILFDGRKGISGFRMRVGVHSGPAFLGTVGLRLEYTAMGDTVNIAARLQSAAPEGSVIISHDAYRHVRNDFTFEQRDPVTLKGLDAPLKTWVVVSSAPRRFGQVGTAVLGIRTPLIGRDDQLMALRSAMDRVMSTGSPFMVTVSGEAGIGKSRLLHEFRSIAEIQDEDSVFFNARCTPEMKNVPCSVFRDILRFRMNVMEDESAESALGKLMMGMGRYLTEDEICLACHFAGFDFSDFEPVRRLIGTPSLGAEGSSALIAYFRKTCGDSRTLMYIEDLHWADSASIDLMIRIMSEIREGRLLMIALTRPPLFDEYPDWGKGLPGDHLRLGPLSEENSRQLVGGILEKVKGIPPVISRTITETADGNPFYMEELMAMLADEGVITRSDSGLVYDSDAMPRWTVPPTLNGVLQARLDSLPDTEKELLQRASVIGRIFWDRAVSDLCDIRDRAELSEGLSSVESRNLVLENDESTFTHTREFLFKHAILRDVTYETVLLDHRRTYHRRTAGWIISHSGNRTSEFSGLIAEHYFRGDDLENAVVWLVKSGRSAFSTSAYNEALFSLRRALDIVPDDFSAGELAELHLLLGKTLDKLTRYDESELHLEKARLLSVEQNMPATAADALLGLAWLASVRGRRETSREMGTAAYEEARRSGDRAILARAIMRMADFDEECTYESRLSYYRESYRIYSDLGDLTGLAITTLNMGNVAMAFEKTDEAEDSYTESLHYYSEIGNKWGVANCLGNLGNVALSRGDFQSSRDLHGKSLEISSTIGDMEGVVICNLNLGRDEHALGNSQKGFGHHCTALRLAVDLGIPPLALGALYEMNRHFRSEGDLEKSTLCLLAIMKYRESFFENSPEIDPDGDLEEIMTAVRQPEFRSISDFVERSSLEELADSLLQELSDPPTSSST